MRPRDFLPNLLVLGTSTALCLILLELAVRIILPQQVIRYRPDIFQPADSIGFVFRPNLDTRVNTGEREVALLTDSLGLRVGGGRPLRPVLARRILLLGDSFMAALQVDYEQSLAGLLDSRLPAIVGEPVVVRNTGVPDWGPSQYFLRARELLAKEPFDLVLVSLYVDNDVVRARTDYTPPRRPVQIARLGWPASFSWNGIIEAWLRPANDYLEQHSQLFVFMRTRLRGTLKRVGLTPEYIPDDYRRDVATSDRWAITAGIAADIADEAASYGIPALFMLIPASFQVDRATFYEYLEGFGVDSSTVDADQPSRLLHQHLVRRGLDVIDLLSAFRTAAASGAQLYGKVDRHLSPEGHALLATLVAPQVVTSLKAGPAAHP